MKRIAVAFTGASNSGKTTLILNLSKQLQKDGFKVCIVKHDPKDRAIFDKEGKDSHKFTNTGADVAVVSSTRTTLFKKQASTIEQMAEMFGEFDYLLVEGLKSIPLPRIAVQRGTLDKAYFELSDAIAVDESIDHKIIPQSCDYLDLNDPLGIISWIDTNGKKM